MQKVIPINLNGNAYQLDETAYETLRAYMAVAEAQLKDNPDRAEIVADLEQAIAEKCARFLGPRKTVVTSAEMDQIVKEMGPVEGAQAAAAGSEAGARDDGRPHDSSAPRKRLYRIRDGAMWAGVCTGIAAYLDVDVVIVRIIFLAIAFVTVGWAFIAYWALVFVIPEAHTSDEHAEARGQPPFNASDIVDHAKKMASDVASGFAYSTRAWRAEARASRAEDRAWRHAWKQRVKEQRAWQSRSPIPPPVYAWAAPGPLLPLFGIVSVAGFVVLVWAIASLVNNNAVFGLSLPTGFPQWVGVVVLIMLFQLITAPFRAARHAYYAWGHPYAWFAIREGFSAAVTLFFIWVLYRHMPPTHDLREFMQNLPDAFRAVGDEIGMWARTFIQDFK